MKTILKYILKILAKRVISRYRPTVIGITGSVGKSTAKEAIFSVLRSKFLVRKNVDNYNNEFGVPMAVLAIDPIKFKSFGYKLTSLLSAIWLVMGWREKYPKFLVLELAADRPGDIKYLSDIVMPSIGVVTAIGEVPVHVQFYASPKEVAVEKANLIRNLPISNGLAILNYDDQTVLDMKEISKAKTMTFGLSPKKSDQGPDVWASDISYFINHDSNDSGQIGGLAFKINTKSSFIPTKVNNLIGVHQLYGILAGVAVGLNFGVNLIDIAGSLENIELPHQRMNLMSGVKNSFIIDDSYNASPLSTRAALETLKNFNNAKRHLEDKTMRSGRRIAILGDMKELGKYEIEAHRAIGNIAAECCDVLITVGAAAKFIADSAANQMSTNSIFSFNTSEEARAKAQEVMGEGDVVLVKGSRSMKMEVIVEELFADISS